MRHELELLSLTLTLLAAAVLFTAVAAGVMRGARLSERREILAGSEGRARVLREQLRG